MKQAKRDNFSTIYLNSEQIFIIIFRKGENIENQENATTEAEGK
jgi:hypothetical protein